MKTEITDARADRPKFRSQRASRVGASFVMPWLDWLRFAAAMAVLFSHVRARVWVEYAGLEPSSQGAITQIFFLLTRLGHESVLIFFVLSGFLVGGRGAERLSRGTFDWRDYAVDRATRVFVPLIPAVLFTVFVMFMYGSPPTLISVIGNTFLLQGVLVDTLDGNGPLWSLSYEGWFYIIFGAFLGLVGHLQIRTWIAGVLFGISVVVFAVLDAAYLLVWCLGTCAYWFRRETPSRTEIATAIIIALVGVAISQAVGNSRAFHAVDVAVDAQRLGGVILGLGAALLLRNLSASRVAVPGYDDAGSKLAAFSYSLYLFHYPLLFSAAHLGIERSAALGVAEMISFVALSAGCIGFSWLAYQLFEKHTSKVRNQVGLLTGGTRNK